jgi:hypothetical protein
VLTGLQQLAPPEQASVTQVNGTGPLAGTLTGDLAGLPGVTVTWATRINGTPAPGAYIATYIRQVPSPSTLDAFTTAVHRAGQEIGSVAYVMIADKTGLNSTGPATVTMTVPQDWVTRNGGTGVVRIVRMGEDGTGEVLLASPAGYDRDSGYLVFAAASQNGLSTFGLAAVKPGAPAQASPPAQAPVTPASGIPLFMGASGVIAAIVIIAGVALLLSRRRKT